jgi:hypothetical protein
LTSLTLNVVLVVVRIRPASDNPDRPRVAIAYDNGRTEKAGIEGETILHLGTPNESDAEPLLTWAAVSASSAAISVDSYCLTDSLV